MAWWNREPPRPVLAADFSGIPERYSIDKTALWGQGADFTSSGIHAGVEVSQSTALQLVAVYACIRILSESVAALPADAFRRRGEQREALPRPPAWLSAPNPETTWFEFAERVMGCLNIDGNAFVIITARDALGYPSELWTLHPSSVRVRRERGKTDFVWEGSTVLSRFGPDNPAGDVLHIKAFSNGGLRGLSPIDTARQAIGLGIVAEKHGAKYFGGDQTPPGLIEIPAMSQQDTQETVDSLTEKWSERHGGSDKAGKVGVLTGGAHFNAMAIPNDQAQFLETRKFQVQEIARLFRVPPHLIQELDSTTSWGTGIEQQSIGFVRYSLLPWLVRLEQGFSQLLPRGSFVKFNVKGLLRGDAAAQAQAYSTAIDHGWMNRAEVRADEDLPAEPGLDVFLVPVNLQGSGAVKTEPAPVVTPPAPLQPVPPKEPKP